MAILTGIAVSNTGTIKDCYVIWNKSNKNKKTLLSNNSGSIITSALIGKGSVKEIIDNNGDVQTEYSIQKTSDIKKIGFDTNNCWEYAGNNTLVKFQDKNWYFNIEKSNVNVIHIKTTEQYIAFAEKVNSGDDRAKSSFVILECDLNFHGKKIPIIGKTRECAFSGVFSGNNHLIWNGELNDETALYVGLFGYLKGKVCNLIFDGRVVSDKNLAGLCGMNMGEISCCGSVVRLKPKDERYNAAGIVVNNDGTINRCYTVIQKKLIIPPFVYILIIALVAIMLGFLGYFTIISALDLQKDYTEIEVDPGQKKMPDNNPEKNEDNSIAFTLNKTVDISRGSRTCRVSFINPSSDANKIVAELQVVNGSGQRVTIGSSKAVSPGYGIDSIPLTNVNALTGNETEGYIVLTPYNNVTESKSIVTTELPVTITYSD